MTKRSLQGQQARQVILNYIRAYKEASNGQSPTVRDIKAACHIASTSTVTYHLERLRKQGAIKIIPVARGIHLPGEQYTLPDPVQVK